MQFYNKIYNKVFNKVFIKVFIKEQITRIYKEEEQQV